MQPLPNNENDFDAALADEYFVFEDLFDLTREPRFLTDEEIKAYVRFAFIHSTIHPNGGMSVAEDMEEQALKYISDLTEEMWRRFGGNDPDELYCRFGGSQDN